MKAEEEPTWIAYDDARVLHDVLIQLHGGAPGVRDAGVIESALARPQHVFRYETPDLAVRHPAGPVAC